MKAKHQGHPSKTTVAAQRLAALDRAWIGAVKAIENGLVPAGDHFGAGQLAMVSAQLNRAVRDLEHLATRIPAGASDEG